MHNTLLAIMTSGLLASLTSQAAEPFIKNGKIETKSISAKHWNQESGQISAKGTGNVLTCLKTIAAGDFTITTNLTLAELNGTAASFMLGSNHFGFDGRGKKFFLEGREFPKQDLGSNSKILTAGQAFDFTVTRKNSQLSFMIDQQPITTFKFHNNEVASFGFRPHRNTMSISNLSFEGKLLKLPELDYVFACGDNGYKSYRIPSIIKTTQGTLIASCEGRVNGSGDAGDINLVMKRSTDHGKTWSDLSIIRDIKRTAGNPCPVIDQESGRIVMVFCEMDHHEHHIMQGKSKRRVFTTFSDDDGLTWSDPVNITDRANPKGQYNWLASGPGVGIQIQQGKHQGRMVIPFANSIGHDYGVHTIYSDDKGKTWTPSNLIKGGCNESQLVELSDGRLLLNMRMQRNSKGFRGLSSSSDGGATRSPLTHDDELNDPTCQASIITHQGADHRFLIFSNPATGGRNGMTVRVSIDDGQTWPVKKLIYPRSSGYSNLVVTNDKHLLCLFEGGPANYSQSGIAVVRIPLSALNIK